MESIEHRTIRVNGINMHVAEKGHGPVILFIHGFPELWYTWRHQMEALACLGYRAVAPDLRGYGDTDAPSSPETYTCLHVVGDLVALIDDVVGPEGKVFVVGHDWGAVMAWYLCMFRPDRVNALVNLSVAYNPRNPNINPLRALKAIYGEDYYVMRFQRKCEEELVHDLSNPLCRLILKLSEFAASWKSVSAITTTSTGSQPLKMTKKEAGEIETEFSQIGTERVLKEFFRYRNTGPLLLPKGKCFGQSKDTPIELPNWLTQQDVDYYKTKFETTGFTGGLNYYRNIERNWELMALWTGAQIKVPVKFIVGDLDLSYNIMGIKDYIHKGGFKKDVPLLEEVVIMEGVGHFINEEKADEISQHIHDFFTKF